MSVFQKVLNSLKLQIFPNIENKKSAEPAVAIASPTDSGSPYRAYAITMLLKAYGNVAPIPEQYPLYYAHECGLTNPKSLHLQLIEEGFLEPSSISQLLTILKVSELQQMLRSCGLKVSGKKEELINRILSNINTEDLLSFFKDEPPRYSLSIKGTTFLDQHKDYIRFHRYTRYGVTIAEYEHAKASFYSTDCEQILIFLYNQKLRKDEYNRLYHLVLHKLYEAIGDSDNALREFLIVKYFDVNYVYAFQQLDSMLQYLSFPEAARSVYECQKDCYVLSPNDAVYIAQHPNIHLQNVLNSIYSHYVLKDLLIPKSIFSTILSEMLSKSFFDISKWNTYILEQLKHYLRLH